MTSRPVVLIAENDAAVRLVAFECLSRDGCLVLSAADADGAVAIWHERGPVDLLLTDVKMPGRSGAQLAHDLRELQPGVPVVFLTEGDADPVAQKGAPPAEAGFLPKPFTPEGLRSTVRERLGPPARAPRVLLVDDEPAISIPMASYFRQLGCSTQVAGEAEEAAALAVHRRYDLAILDLRLTRWGGGEGLQVIEEVRRGSPGAAIVVLSAYVDDDAEREARRRGADAVLRKPHPLPGVARVAFDLIGGDPCLTRP
jgi:CheY-like chemotaxis protein